MSIKSENITQLQQKNTAKPMLWVGMISITMMFAGLTSAYVVSHNRVDWKPIEIPRAFLISTCILLLSSGTFYLAQRAIKRGNRKWTSLFLSVTLILGIAFVVSQITGFKELIDHKLYFTGSESTIASSFLYVIAFSHLLHVAAGLVVLSVVIYKHFKYKYNAKQHLGIELGALFWHFLDLLWLYLFLFLYFMG